MTEQRFKELLAATRMASYSGGQSRTAKALFLHLVDGLSIPDAARQVGISAQTVDEAVRRLPRERCAHCNQILPKDGATVRAGVSRAGKAKASASKRKRGASA